MRDPRVVSCHVCLQTNSNESSKAQPGSNDVINQIVTLTPEQMSQLRWVPPGAGVWDDDGHWGPPLPAAVLCRWGDYAAAQFDDATGQAYLVNHYAAQDSEEVQYGRGGLWISVLKVKE